MVEKNKIQEIINDEQGREIKILKPVVPRRSLSIDTINGGWSSHRGVKTSVQIARHMAERPVQPEAPMRKPTPLK